MRSQLGSEELCRFGYRRKAQRQKAVGRVGNNNAYAVPNDKLEGVRWPGTWFWDGVAGFYAPARQCDSQIGDLRLAVCVAPDASTGDRRRGISSREQA